MKINDVQTEAIKQRLDPKCWKGKHKEGTKIKGGVRVNNCVPNESVEEAANPAQQAAIAIAKKKEAGVDEARVGNRMSDIELGNPKIVNYKGKAVGEVGIDHEASPGNGQYYMKHYLTGKDMVGYETKQEALAELKYIVQQYEGQQGVAEEYNPEYDDEAGSVKSNLYTIAKAAQGLMDTIGDRDDLPEWVQEKIAKVEGMLVTSWNYMQSQKAQGIDSEIEEMYEAMDRLALDMARKNRVSVDAVWESFEALPDNMLYETAAWHRKAGKNKNGGLNAKGVASYRREHPGSKLQTAVTTKPSKLKPGSKAAKRRKSFCARMSGVKGPMKKPNGKPTRKALALRKWNC